MQPSSSIVTCCGLGIIFLRGENSLPCSAVSRFLRLRQSFAFVSMSFSWMLSQKAENSIFNLLDGKKKKKNTVIFESSAKINAQIRV